MTLLAEDPKNFRAALWLLDGLRVPNGRYGLVRDFGQALEAKLKARFRAKGWKVVNDLHKREPSIYIRSNARSEFHLGIGADTLNDDFTYGICWENIPDGLKRDIQGAFDTEFEDFHDETTQEKAPFPWFRNVPAFKGIPVHRWIEPEAFVAMQNQQSDLVDHFADLIVRMEKVVSRVLPEQAAEVLP